MGVKLWDTHCHLLDPAVPGGAEAALRRAAVAGVARITVVESEPERWTEAVSFCSSRPGLVCACGIHPCFVEDAAPELLDLLRTLPVDAIGEIGLDRTAPDFDLQLDYLRSQLRIAADRGLPVLLHCRRAFSELMAELTRIPPPTGGVMHCYSGGPHYVAPFAEAGMYFSFAEPASRPGAVRAAKALALVPRDRLLVETDAPDMTPLRLRPARNEPANLPVVAEALASVLEMDFPSFAELTFANAERLFNRR